MPKMEGSEVELVKGCEKVPDFTGIYGFGVTYT